MRSANGEGYEQIQRCPSKILSTRLNRVKGVYKRKCLRFTDKAVTVDDVIHVLVVVGLPFALCLAHEGTCFPGL
jgi:hypothetical protein